MVCDGGKWVEAEVTAREVDAAEAKREGAGRAVMQELGQVPVAALDMADGGVRHGWYRVIQTPLNFF
jgi:hypothetical protein